jgi:hypothetical protein
MTRRALFGIFPNCLFGFVRFLGLNFAVCINGSRNNGVLPPASLPTLRAGTYFLCAAT